jgi:hypothetical protein
VIVLPNKIDLDCSCPDPKTELGHLPRLRRIPPVGSVEDRDPELQFG